MELKEGDILRKHEFIAGKPSLVIILSEAHGFYKLADYYNNDNYFFWLLGKIRKHYKHISVGEQKKLFEDQQTYAEKLRDKHLKA